GYEVIAATPGRFIDHMGSGKVDLSNLRYFILDEADRMLDMGFRPQIEDVMRGLRGKGHRVMLFSATMPHGVHDLALRLTDEPAWVEAAPSGTTASGIVEVAYSVKPRPPAAPPAGRRLGPGAGVHPNQGGSERPRGPAGA
ncbi:MAG: DEAD/DEAH box helicase, partial [Gemmatimonadetes bacterium]|nr:DEAD/DEAH box helicase [Gemmatimonadota bacterium]